MAKREEVKAVFRQPGLKRRFKALCAQMETDMSSVIETLVTEWCDRVEQEQKEPPLKKQEGNES
ncbi:MAG: hypothetical protein F6K14_15620 [Symploca sp. SIO2C1]|nr:hypothetical protein [Symploca sp. SIO2C1]